ncbi:MAG: efflux RND transporter periplasmic adaptor subunit [Xanthomonadaceae bacterium]|nr:efflux RND transporter periplasmic adaptor subunit [Xanthomonadaceae bacterium]
MTRGKWSEPESSPDPRHLPAANSTPDLLKELHIDRAGAKPHKSIGRSWWPWMVVGVLIILGITIFSWFGYRVPVNIRTVPAVAISSNHPVSVLDATGYVVARRTSTVSAKITGRVREVLIEEGQHVQEDEIMATLDPIDASAERNLAIAKLAVISSQVSSIQAQLIEAEANAERMRTLAEQQLVSRSQYDQAISQRDSLRAQLATARRNIESANSQLAIAEIGLDNTVIRAPFSGIVTAKAAQPGEIVSPLSAGGGFTRTGIGTIVDMNSLEVEVDVGESFIGRVTPKMPVEATLNAYPSWKIPAEVIAIIPAADRGKATIKVRIALNQKDPRIVPDMGVRVSFLELPTRDGAPLEGVRMAATAVTQRNQQDVAFVFSDGRVEQRNVVRGTHIGNEVQIVSGLTAGEQVVNDPPDSLKDGARAKLAEDQAR